MRSHDERTGPGSEGRTTVEQNRPTLTEVVVKTMVTHTVTYSVMGILALTLLDYARFFAESGLGLMMRRTSDPWVMAAPLYQPIRGILFGLVFYLLRASIFNRKNGWLVIWAVLVAFGIIGTFGPAPGSMEGMAFTVFPWWVHARSLPEGLLQSLSLAALLSYWVDHPQKKWLRLGHGHRLRPRDVLSRDRPAGGEADLGSPPCSLGWKAGWVSSRRHHRGTVVSGRPVFRER
jgi:hypothetical protein